MEGINLGLIYVTPRYFPGEGYEGQEHEDRHFTFRDLNPESLRHAAAATKSPRQETRKTRQLK
jgi:hypothetical protein